MDLTRKPWLVVALMSGAAVATPPPPVPQSNVMLQFTCLTLSPPTSTGETIGSLRPPPAIRSERVIGERQARHRIMLSATRAVGLEERLVTSEECSGIAQDINWVLASDGSRSAQFCIAAIPGFLDANVIVRISVPPLQTDYDRRVMREFLAISSCRVGSDPFLLSQGRPFVQGRTLLVPPIFED